MKCICLAVVLCTLVVFTSVAYGESFYWSPQGEVPVIVDSTKLSVVFNTSVWPDSATAAAQRYDLTPLLDYQSIEEFLVCSLGTGQNYDSMFNLLAQAKDVRFIEPFITDEQGKQLAMGTEICVGVSPECSASALDSLFTSLHVEISDTIMSGCFLVKRTRISEQSLLDVANTLHASPLTRYAHPNFAVEIAQDGYSLYDYYHVMQDHTKHVIGTFNVATVWDFAGLDDPIVVSIQDDGVCEHEDLDGDRIISGYDYADHDSVTTPSSIGSHGMACAGIMAADHTTDPSDSLYSSTGIISINPNITLLVNKIFCDSLGNPIECVYTYGDIASAISDAAESGAWILSNSWNFINDQVEDKYVINDAIDTAFYSGRGGLGCPVIFSAGNSGRHFVKYPARLDNCFAVGATNLNDSIWSYSSYGFSAWPDSFPPPVVLDIMAPSSDGGLFDPNDTIAGTVWTLDQMGTLGINDEAKEDDPEWNCSRDGMGNDWNYNCQAGGTSMSAPLVAGIASLILAKDPTLTATEVYDVLKGSAVRDFAWGSITPPDSQYGYGRVDAFRAILSLSRGDVDNSDQLDIADIVQLIDYVFNSGPEPFPSPLLGDCDCDSDVDIADIEYWVEYSWGDPPGPPPVKPCYAY